MLLVEPADNIGGGGPGDCTDVMRAFLKHDIAGAGVIICDAAAVAFLQDVPIGGRARSISAARAAGWIWVPSPWRWS